MKDILAGKKPTAVFQELLVANPKFKTKDIADAFIEAFPKIDYVVVPYIWRWNRPGATRGLSSERVDEVLLEELRKAGYLN